MARTKQTARKSTGGKPPRKQLVSGGPSKVRLPVAAECSQEPKTEDAQEVAKASIVLRLKGVSSFMKKTGNAGTSASISVGGIQWQLRVQTSAAGYGGEVMLGFTLEGVHESGAWSRWLTADFFVDDQKDWRKLRGVRETLVGSAPLPCSAGEPRLVSEQSMRYGEYSFVYNHDDSATFRVDFACWKDSFQEKGAFDDVAFVVEGRPVYSNRGYMAYISPVMRAMLTGNFKEAQSDQVLITQTSAEDFVTFMRAVAPCRDPVSDTNVQARYGLADVYDVEFLRRDCEKHMMATKGIDLVDKFLLAHSLNKADFITRLIGSLSQADFETIRNHGRRVQLPAKVKSQLREKLLAEIELSSDFSF